MTTVRLALGMAFENERRKGTAAFTDILTITPTDATVWIVDADRRMGRNAFRRSIAFLSHEELHIAAVRLGVDERFHFGLDYLMLMMTRGAALAPDGISGVA